MSMEQMRETFDKNMKKSLTNFETIYKTYEDKISFLKSAQKDPTFIENIEQSNLIKESIHLLVENAKVTETRKMQQAYLMPTIQMMFQNVSVEDFAKEMKNKPEIFSAFCIMYISFFYDPMMKDHGNQHHENIIKSLNKYVSGLINL